MRRRKRRILGLALAAVLLVGATVAGTLAYLMQESNEVKNTFTAANLIEGDFKLLEHEATRGETDGKYTLGENEVESNSYIVTPGNDLPKDPFVKVTVKERAYLFLEVIDTLPTDAQGKKILTWDIDGTYWEALTENETQVVKDNHPIYVYKVNNAYVVKPGTIDANNSNIIASKTITVPNNFNANLTEANTLQFQAYLTQATDFDTPLAAWKATYGATAPTP